jgi:RNA polymerase sigma-70 factor (ECF subfamily)
LDVVHTIARSARDCRNDRARNRFFTELVESHGDAAFRTAYRLLGERELAHDAVQDALARALDRLPEVQSQDDAAAWLFRVLVNGCMSKLRRRAVISRAMAILGRGEPPRRTSPSDEIDFAHRVAPELSRLPLKQRIALVLRYGDERSVSEIAHAMGISPETVKTHLKRGLTTLRGQLGVQPGGRAP